MLVDTRDFGFDSTVVGWYVLTPLFVGVFITTVCWYVLTPLFVGVF